MKKLNIYLKSCLAALLLMACSAEEPAELDPSLVDNTPDEEVVLTQDTEGNSDADADGANDTQYFRAKIDGVDFEAAATDFNAVYTTDGVDGPITGIKIFGKVGSQVISLWMPQAVLANNDTPYPFYPLGNSSTDYAAAYNTSNTDTYYAAVNGGMHVTFDDMLWVSDVVEANVNGGVTTINGYKGNSANGETFNMLLNAVAVAGYQFGPIAPGSAVNNTASYTNVTNSVVNGVYNNLNDVANGNIAITKFDADNKLMSGTFNFDGRRYFTPNVVTPTGPDTDGDGVKDSVEIANGTDINDPCSPVQPAAYTGYDSTNAVWLAGDCDNDGTTNQDEINGPDGDPLTTADNTDPYEGNVDTDGDGVSDTQETLDGTDVNDPCSPAQAEGYVGYDATVTTWQNADCDGDGTTNQDEINGPDGDPLTTADNTDPYFVEYEMKPFTSGTFTNITYTGDGAVNWGLRVALHVNGSRIVGTFSFITASLGQDPVVSHVITDGSFDIAFLE